MYSYLAVGILIVLIMPLLIDHHMLQCNKKKVFDGIVSGMLSQSEQVEQLILASFLHETTKKITCRLIKAGSSSF